MFPDTLRRCKRCLLPETYETIEFDAEGICNICRSTEHKQKEVDWDERKRLLDRLIEKYRGKGDYDCIVPFSGGKDSTFQLYYLMKEYRLKPLVVRFNHGFMRPTIQDNNQRILKKLGVDVLEFTPNWRIVKKLMLESFTRKTDFCWHCHTGIYSYPLRIAIKFKTPLLFWGEPLSEISAYYDYLNDEIEYEDEKKFNMVRNLGISADDRHVTAIRYLSPDRPARPHSLHLPPAQGAQGDQLLLGLSGQLHSLGLRAQLRDHPARARLEARCAGRRAARDQRSWREDRVLHAGGA